MIIVGSQIFFKGLPNYFPKDIDYVEIVEKNPISVHFNDKCIFQIVRKPKEKLLDDVFRSIPMAMGKFLVPGFIKEFDITIEDLKKLEPITRKLDAKHRYEKIIFDSYIENGDFYLTDEQRMKAYEEYLKYR